MARDRCPDETGGGKDDLCRVYASMAFLDSHIDAAKKTVKEMESLMDAGRMLKYYREQLDYVSYCVKDISGKIWKCIEESVK